MGASWSSAWPGSGRGVPELASVAARCRCRRRWTSRQGSRGPRRRRQRIMEALSHPPAPLRGRAMRDLGGAGELEASSASSLTGYSSRAGGGSEAGAAGRPRPSPASPTPALLSPSAPLVLLSAPRRGGLVKLQQRRLHHHRLLTSDWTSSAQDHGASKMAAAGGCSGSFRARARDRWWQRHVVRWARLALARISRRI